MPVRTRIIPQTGLSVLEHLCEDCGKPAYFGIGVFLNKAFQAFDNDKMELAKELLGKWYCVTHWRKKNVQDCRKEQQPGPSQPGLFNQGKSAGAHR